MINLIIPHFFLENSSSSIILGNDRRFMVVEFLRKNNNTAEISQLVDYIAKMEGNESRRHRKSIYVSLVQTHLPKMEREGIIKVERGRIMLVNVPKEVDKYIDIEKSSSMWPIIYACFSCIGLIFSLLRGSGEGVIISLILLGLALAHWSKIVERR
ncbi:hypothetical protein [Pyrococcus sp. ST04]|uniref:DUF7344 domain-containing protein n=1 Tax=Pyrococcus sp. ST04 TaxID=1183377 RepID=UPI000260589D|nr:hypothetical protein [Pyrococcus sp. ST04]AFK22210.1 hypothetical protein Py04_0608 [Pyrococcus sp. ST04]